MRNRATVEKARNVIMEMKKIIIKDLYKYINH
jgi:hypothetical protein